MTAGACEGCGSIETMEAIRARGFVSCCPERKMLTARQWRDRAERAEAALTRMAHYQDTSASDWLAKTGSYSLFDEPGAVRLSRETLALRQQR